MMKQRRYLRLGAMLTAIALFMSLFLLGCGGSSGTQGNVGAYRTGRGA